MTQIKPLIQAVIGATLLSGLSGCAGDPVAIADVVKDKKAYLQLHYSPAAINEKVYKKLPLDQSPPGKGDFKVYMTSHVVATTGKTLDRKLMNTYSVLGKGLVHVIEEFSSNDIPDIYNFAISYQGLIPIKSLEAFPSERQSRMPEEIKEVTSWDSFDYLPGVTYTANYKFGTVMQIVAGTETQVACTMDKQINASEIHKKLDGHAQILNCTTSINGIVSYRQKRIHLDNLQVVIPAETINPNFKETFTVVDVTGI